ncbi:MAG: transcriptional repressor general negative regulator of transcription subunit 4 [Sclerophora amabilis]|nr:MAG: transcriptional repressor general negative regulator of transcription subunit 4 [Sclerophora amabilis]
MASRVQQDSFIDDSDETCPLCVEEFDLSDRNFRPCPCGYQVRSPKARSTTFVIKPIRDLFIERDLFIGFLLAFGSSGRWIMLTSFRDQVCQFCFNNIRSNMNGLCPACRRPYDEKTIEWKVVSPEEFKADLQKQARKKAELRQKEAQKKEVETTQRKHLAGLRVVQKNLVYIVGLNPRIREEDLLQTLRGEQYFGQYGKIIKIVVSKAKEGAQGTQPLGVYVTFARRQDAERCIAAVDGSENGGRTLRAQFGTTKYCSAYLRNEQCMNKNCMFLHEAGEEKDSFTRQDLSSINVVGTQRPAQATSSPSSSIGISTSLQGQAQSQHPQQQPAPHAAQHPMAATAPTMGAEVSKDGAVSPADGGDGSALPSSASWATKGQLQSRRTSHPTSASTPSPKARSASLVSQSRGGTRNEVTAAESSGSNAASESSQLREEQKRFSNINSPQEPSEHRTFSSALLDRLLKAVTSPDFKFVFSKSMFTPEEYEAIVNHPPLLDPNGGAKRRALREAEENERRIREDETAKALQLVSDVQADEPSGSGSLQLGGEPEDRRLAGEAAGRAQGGSSGTETARQVIQPPPQQGQFGSATQNSELGHSLPSTSLSSLSINGRGLTPSQQQHLLFLKSGNSQNGNFLDQLPQDLVNQSQQTQSGLFQSQTQNQNQNPNQNLTAQGHTRQASRFSFANDSSSASAAVKPAANAKLMAQQSSMMPPGAGSSSQAIQHQQHMGGRFFTNGVPGPPPGLKSAGTPPVSGGGMFSQGHGFANTMVGGLGMGGNMANADSKSEMLRDMIRTRGGMSGNNHNQGLDMGKREFMFPSFSHQYPSNATSAPAPGLVSSLYGPQSGASQDSGHQKHKKKGKKHRHANTSSFGGSGIVDLADPSILQARMQQQGASGPGQGLFGGQGQGQGGYNPAINRDATPLEEATSSVDALVNDESKEPAKPGQFNGLIGDQRRPKPSSLPPGLSSNLPHSLPPLEEEPSPTTTRPVDSSLKVLPQASRPVVPVVPTHIRPATPNIPAQTGAFPAKSPAVVSEESKDTQPANIKPKISHHEQQKALPTAAEAEVQQKPGRASQKATASGLPISTNLPAKPPKPEKSKSGREGSKRSPPEKLDIDAATRNVGKESTETSAKPNITRSSASPYNKDVPEGSPAPASRQAQPKTLRVVQTPKAETPPPVSSTSAATVPPVASPAPSSGKLPSRKASVISLNRPSTPASELISDNASLTSASRPNSPPPIRLGSTPVRQTTKSQLKKQRKEKKELEKTQEQTEAQPVVEGKEIAPIIGRKKKKAKPNESTAGDSTAPTSRPTTPPPADTDKGKGKETEKATVTPVAKEAKTEVTNVEEDKTDTGTPTAEDESATTEPSQRPNLTPSSIIGDLMASQELDPSNLEFFKPIPSVNHRFDISPVDYNELHRKITITSDEQSKLANGEPIRFDNSSDGDKTDRSSVLISPNGYLLRGLTPSQQARFLSLEKCISTSNGPNNFIPTRQGTENGFFMIGGRVVQSGSGNSIFSPSGPGHSTSAFASDRNTVLPNTAAHLSNLSDAASKMRVDEALNYINQFVLPALPRTAAAAKVPSQPPAGGSSEGAFGLASASGHSNSTPAAAPARSAGSASSEQFVPKAPDPANYSPYASPPTGFGADVAGVMHGMVVGADPNATGRISTTSAAAAALPYSHLAPPGQLPAVPLLSVDDAEAAMAAAKRETEIVEKRLSMLWKKNKRFVGAGVGGH